MKRRGFLRNATLGAIALSFAPSIILSKDKPELLFTKQAKGYEVIIDHINKEIRLADNDNLPKISVRDLYNFLKEEWKEDEELIRYPFPVVAYTPEMGEMINGWEIQENSYKNICKGTIRQGEDEYVGFTSIGYEDIDEDTITMEADGEYYKGKSNLVKNPKEVHAIDSNHKKWDMKKILGVDKFRLTSYIFPYL